MYITDIYGLSSHPVGTKFSIATKDCEGYHIWELHGVNKLEYVGDGVVCYTKLTSPILYKDGTMNFEKATRLTLDDEGVEDIKFMVLKKRDVAKIFEQFL